MPRARRRADRHLINPPAWKRRSVHSQLRRNGTGLLIALAAFAWAPPAAAQNSWRHEAGEWSAAAAALGGAYLLDVRIRDAAFIRADTTIPRLARLSDPLGRPTTYAPVLGLAYAAGVVSGNPELAAGALRAATALAVAEVGTRSLKFLVGRGRPDTPGSDGDEFQPATVSPEWSSFPSGHATTAFAAATILDWETDEPWVAPAAYGAAALVAWARVRENRHWTSDVVAGALVGVFLSEVTLRTLGQPEDDPRAHGGAGVPLVLFAVPAP
jgi:membrane-associated phospholipid phosphatase